MGNNVVWCQCPLLPRSCLWDQEVNEVLPLASSLHQVSHPPPTHQHSYLQYFFISVFNVVVGVINAIVNFVFLNLFG